MRFKLDLEEQEHCLQWNNLVLSQIYLRLQSQLLEDYPLAVLLAVLKYGGIGGTFGGNPISCAAALAVLEIMDDEKLPQRALEIGSKIVSVINQLKKEVRYIKSIRGLGAMQGIEIVDENGDTDKDRVLKIHQHALQNGLVMITAGTFGNVIRTLMPLTISNAELNQSLDILCDALKNS